MRLLFSLASLLLTLVVAMPVSAEPIIIKFAHVVRPDTPKGTASEYFKRLVEQRSEGRVRVELYPNGELGNEQQLLAALKSNRIQMAAPSLSKIAGVNRQLQLFDLPFLFRDLDHLHRVIDGKIGQTLLAGASRKGLVALAFWDNGFKQLTANRPLIVPQDAAGLRMRIEGSEVQKAQFVALNATTKVIPFPRLYDALRDRKVDGQENTLSNIDSQKLDLVQSDLTISNHGYLEYLVLSNEQFWQQTPEELRVIIKGAIKDAAEYNREMAQKVNEQALQHLISMGRIRIHRLSPPQRSAWQQQLNSVYRLFSPQIGKELVEQILQQ